MESYFLGDRYGMKLTRHGPSLFKCDCAINCQFCTYHISCSLIALSLKLDFTTKLVDFEYPIIWILIHQFLLYKIVSWRLNTSFKIAGQRVIGETVASGLVLDESWLWHPDFKTAARQVPYLLFLLLLAVILLFPPV